MKLNKDRKKSAYLMEVNPLEQTTRCCSLFTYIMALFCSVKEQRGRGRVCDVMVGYITKDYCISLLN